ncbi:MAG: hypothetical protein AAFV19_23980, partial [Pseudomonadota bacterium]
MAEAGKKLTIRMPDNPRLKTAVVKEVHLDPGARVQIGSPVMSLTARRKTHLVRSPKSGRVVPLVAPNDTISGGDPLYVINVETDPAPRVGEESRDLVPTPKRRWSPGMLPDDIEPIDRARPRPDDVSHVNRFAATWGKPVLSVGVYVVACFALLPILNAVSRVTTGAVPYMLMALALLFALMLFYFYAPREGRWQRNTVRFVAMSWVAVSALAVFYKPQEPTDITLDAAQGPILALFAEPEQQIAAAVPKETVSPPAVTKSGVLVGTVPRAPGAQFVPAEVALLDISTAPVPHGVSVEELTRANPDNSSGEALAFEQADLAPPEQTAPVLVARAEDRDRTLAEAPAFPDELALATLIAQTPEADRALPDTAAPAVLATLDTAVTGVQESAEPTPSPAAAPAAPLAGLPTAATEPAAIAEPVLEALDVLLSDPVVAAWIATNPVPIIASATAPATELRDLSYTGSRTSGALVRPGPPSRLPAQTSPELMLLATLRSGESAWMSEQAGLLATTGTEPPAVAVATPGPVDQAEAEGTRLGAELTSAGDATLTDAAPGSPAAERTPILVLRGDGAAAPSIADDLAVLSETDAPPQSGTAPDLRLAYAAVTAPRVPTAEPEPETDLLASVDPAERVLLFLYFDDPRLGTHPRVGDEWLPAASLELRDAITEARVEEVREIVQVVAWCAAANDPEGAKEANLPGGAYRAALLTDRIRLLQVRVTLPGNSVETLEQQIPVFGGAEPGFFHNRAPLMGGTSDEPVMERARAWLAQQSNRTADPNTPQGITGGQYFDSAESAEAALTGAGCAYVFWRDDPQPVNEIGR